MPESLSQSQLPAGLELSPARMRLFETALTLFHERGYYGVSVRDITEALGQNPGAIYAHVSSKQALLCELVVIGHRALDAEIRSAIAAAGDDPVEQIRAIVRAHVSLHLELPALARVINIEFRYLEPHQTEGILAIRAGTELMVIDVITRGRELGVFSNDDPYLALNAISAMGSRSAEWWSANLPFTAAHVAERFADFAVRILR